MIDTINQIDNIDPIIKTGSVKTSRGPVGVPWREMKQGDLIFVADLYPLLPPDTAARRALLRSCGPTPSRFGKFRVRKVLEGERAGELAIVCIERNECST